MKLFLTSYLVRSHHPSNAINWLRKYLAGLSASLALFIAANTNAAITPSETEEPMRIVTAGGSITEIIFALGKGDKIVAADSTSLFPAEARQLPKIGYFRQIGAESVMSFQPTKLIGAQAMGPDATLAQIRDAGVDIHVLGENRSYQGLQSMVQEIGSILGRQQQAEALVADMDKRVNALTSVSRDAAKQNPVTALYVLSNADRGLTVAGQNTVPQALFEAARINNAASQIKNYKLMDNEAIVKNNPDFIILASHRFPEADAIKQICQHPAIRFTNAGRECRVLTMDSSMSLGLSTRFPEALAQLIAFSFEDIDLELIGSTAAVK